MSLPLALFFASASPLLTPDVASQYSLGSSLTYQVSQTAQVKAGKTILPWDQFSILSSLMALNVCYAVDKKVDYKVAGAASVAALFSFIRDEYNGAVKGAPVNINGTPGLVRWIALDLQLRVVSKCKDKLPKAIVMETEQIRRKLSEPATKK